MRPAESDPNACSGLVVWRLIDGRPGHEKQSAGLLQGIKALRSVDVHEFDMRSKAGFWKQVRTHARQRAPTAPAPDLIVGVGHRTHLPMVMARAACGGKSVVLMKPTLPHSLFDLIFVPRHDRTRPRPNVVETNGVVCPSSDADKAPRSGLILLGGASRHFEWRVDNVTAQIAAIARAAPDVRWQVCDSRRTPDAMRDALPTSPNLRYCPWRATPNGFLEKELATASYVWVTADSASMLYEALSARAQVGIIALDAKHPRRDNKHVRGIRRLLAEGHVSSTSDGFRLDNNQPATPPYAENQRCAKIVIDRLVESA